MEVSCRISTPVLAHTSSLPHHLPSPPLLPTGARSCTTPDLTLTRPPSGVRCVLLYAPFLIMGSLTLQLLEDYSICVSVQHIDYDVMHHIEQVGVRRRRGEGEVCSTSIYEVMYHIEQGMDGFQ